MSLELLPAPKGAKESLLDEILRIITAPAKLDAHGEDAVAVRVEEARNRHLGGLPRLYLGPMTHVTSSTEGTENSLTTGSLMTTESVRA